MTDADASSPPVTLRTIGREWGRLGTIGFGGPPAHVALLRQLSVEENQWLRAEEFEHALTATSLLPGPASTQLMIYVAWRLRGVRGALLGGLCFILPGLGLIVALSALFFARHPSRAVLGAALGAGAVVPAIAVRTAWQLGAPNWRQRRDVATRVRGTLYFALGATVTFFVPSLVVLALLACGAVEVVVRHGSGRGRLVAVAAAHTVILGGLGALAWVAFKVGGLSYGGGFVIVPLMQHDVVSTYHWMSGAQFLNTVALGQVTPGPVVLTIAAVGYAVRGVTGALLATLVAFAPSFLMVIVAARHFERLRTNPSVTAFLAGAGPSVIGAIGVSALALAALLTRPWQWGLLFVAATWLIGMRRGSTSILLVAAAVGSLVTLTTG